MARKGRDFVVLLFALLAVMPLSAQNQPEWMWGQIAHSINQWWSFIDLVSDSQDNYYVLSSPNNFTTANITKFNSYGEPVWSSDLYNQNYGMGIVPQKMAIDSQDNIYLLGRSGNKIMLAKMSPDGDFYWMRYTADADWSYHTALFALAVDNQDNPIIVYRGEFSNTQTGWSGGGGYAYGHRMIKFSPNGETMINRESGILDTSANGDTDHAAGLYCSQSGDVYLYGRTPLNSFEGFPLSSGGQNFRNVFICKYDNSLEPQQVNGLYSYTIVSDYPKIIVGAMTESADGSIIVSGGSFWGTWSGSSTMPPAGWYTGKVGTDSTWEWLVSVGGHEIHKSPDGNYYVGNRDGISKINDDGLLIYTKSVTFSGGGYTFFDSSIAVDSRNDCVIGTIASGTAYFDDYQAGGSDYYGTFVGKAGVPKPELVAMPQTLDLGSSSPGYESLQHPLVIHNAGTGNLQIDSMAFTTHPSIWQAEGVDLTDPGITIAPRDSLVLQFSFIPDAVQTYADTLLIVYNNDAEPVARVVFRALGVNLPPATPDGPTIMTDGQNIHLSWLPVTTTIYGTDIVPDYYFVYHSNDPYTGYTLLALTPDLSYTHPYITIGAERMFYRITAVKFYRKETDPAEYDKIVRDTFMPGMSEREVREALQGLINSDPH